MNQQMNQQMEKTKLKTKNANKCAAAGMCGAALILTEVMRNSLQKKEQYVRTQLKRNLSGKSNYRNGKSIPLPQ